MTNSSNNSGQPEKEELANTSESKTAETAKKSKTEPSQSPADKQESSPSKPSPGPIPNGIGDIKDRKKEKKPSAKEIEIAGLKEQLAQLTDNNVRLQAEVQNITRRAALELEKVHRFGLEDFAKELIETVDNLEKSLSAIASKDEPIYQGVELTYQALIKTLERFGVSQIDPQGEVFDPNFHEAIGKIRSKQHQANRVVAVIEKGYMLHNRLLRPAKVQIAE